MAEEPSCGSVSLPDCRSRLRPGGNRQVSTLSALMRRSEAPADVDIAEPPHRRRISLFRPDISEEAISAVSEVLRSGWIGPGQKVQDLEAAFASLVGADRCRAVSSGTAAIHLALHLLDLQPGDEVITTALTFVSANQSILYERARPVFADVDPGTGNLDVDSIKSRLSERTRAILAMHYGGDPCDLAEIHDLARSAGVRVIEDCAHAVGASYRGAPIGSQGDLHTFSFQACKILTTGDGGAVLTRSQDEWERLARLRNHGVDRNTFERFHSSEVTWGYDVPELGFKYQMTDIAAAIGIAQMKGLGSALERRSSIARMYRAQLGGVAGLRLLDVKDDRLSSNYMFSILADERDLLAKKLNEAGIEVAIHFPRNDAFVMFENADLPNVESFSAHQLSLPIHAQLSDEEIGSVCNVIRSGW